MKNYELAEIFFELADIMEMKGIQWKPQAFRKVARYLESMPEDIEQIYKQGGIKALKKIPGVGEAISHKIAEYIKTGKIKEYEQLKKKSPKGLSELLEVESLGPKKAEILYEKLKIKSIKDLEKAAKAHKIRKLLRFGPKAEENILEGLKMYKKGKERMLIGEALPLAEEIVNDLKNLKDVNKIEIVGSIRQRRETIRDIDILIATDHPKKIISKFVALPYVKRILAKGTTKASIILTEDIQVDLRVIKKDQWGASMMYFTGSPEHNIKLRQFAIKKGYKLNEYGLFSKRTNKLIASKTEKFIFKKLGLQYIPPELRQNKGEIQAALQHKLPDLIELKDIKGDFQMHTKWSDGADTIAEMAKAAKELRYEYILITDHSKARAISHGLSEKRLSQQIQKIRNLNKTMKNFKILAGIEVDILKNGNLDLKDSILKKCDIVVAAIHSGFKSSEADMTSRICKALQNKNVDILAHPTGRIINRRSPYNVDLKKVFKTAKENNVCIEINAAPNRLDLKDAHIREAIQAGLKLTIGTDAHSPDTLQEFMQYGVFTARRGWAEKKDILNTYSLLELKKFFKKIKT